MAKKADDDSPRFSGRKLKEFRAERGWSLTRLSAEIFDATRVTKNGPGIEVPYQSLSQYESGTEPGATAFIGICKALKKEPEDFAE